MMMLQYSTPPEPSTIFQSFAGAPAKGEALAAGSVLPPGTSSCHQAPPERGNAAITVPTAARWCAGAERPAAGSANIKFGDVFASVRGLRSRSRSRDGFPEKQGCAYAAHRGGTSMFFSSGAPPPPGAAPQQLQPHRLSADAPDSNVDMGCLLNTRMRQAAATASGQAPQSSPSLNSRESGCKQFTQGPYSRPGHPSHDVHNRKRRQGGLPHSGGSAELDEAVSGGRAHGDQPVKTYPAARKPFKHARGPSRTRFDSSGEGRGGRREGDQEGPGGPVGLPARLPNCADTFSVWRGPPIPCQPQPSPPPPPDDSSGATQVPAGSNSDRSQVMLNSGVANSDERRGDCKSCCGPSPGCGAPPPPSQTTKAVLRSCYSDQILDNSRGLPCFKRLKAAFMSVAQVAGHPDLIVPRYLNLTRKFPDIHFRSSALSQTVPPPPSTTTDGSKAPAFQAAGNKRGPPPQGNGTVVHLPQGAQGADSGGAKSHNDNSSTVSKGLSTAVFGGWKTEGSAGEKACASVEPLSVPPTVSLGEVNHPPWSSGTAEAGRQQAVQEEMSEVSSVDSDDDEMEDGEVIEEAARVQTHQQPSVAIKSTRLSRTDVASSGDLSMSPGTARVPPWISTGGLAHTLRSASQQRQMSLIAFPSRPDRLGHGGQPNIAVLDSRKEQQQECLDNLSHYGLSVAPSLTGSTSFIDAELSSSETSVGSACIVTSNAPSGPTSVQQFPSTSHLSASQQLHGISEEIKSTGDKSHVHPDGIAPTVASEAGLHTVLTLSSCAMAARPSEASTGGTMAQPSFSLRSGLPTPEQCVSAAYAGTHVLHSAAAKDEVQGTTGSTSSMQNASCTRPVTSITGTSTSLAPGCTGKSRPVDPRLTRQPKVLAGQQAGSTTLQGPKTSAVSASANTGDEGASSAGKPESVVERKGMAESAVHPVPSPPLGALTSLPIRSKSDNATNIFTVEAQAEPPRYYECSVDGSRVELKPPEAPARGVLPESLTNTCVARGKLPLLLDLDNTLLHAQAAAVTGCDVRLQDWLDEKGDPELFRFELSCNRKSYYMKLRPHLRTFLRVLEPYYEMSVYTNATQEYADIVVAILDENRQLFSDRVPTVSIPVDVPRTTTVSVPEVAHVPISLPFLRRIVARNSGFRGEASENKAVRRMYENMDKRCIVAFDDRQNIWTDLPLSHVVKAQHYDFFDSHRAELNAYYPPLPGTGSNGCGLSTIEALGRIGDEIGVDSELGMPNENHQQNDKQLLKSATSGKKPCDWDKHLDCMLKLFLHIHTEFFKDPAKANVGAILSTVQQGVLAGVGIFFTGYRKTYSPGAAVADCEERQAELAQRLGAKVYKRFDENGVTHVVAGKNNTNNMLACRENTKLSRVHTLWLYCCEAALTRVPEAAFDADALCAYYENCPPTSPYRDHWIHLAQRDRTSDENGGSLDNSKAESSTGSKDISPWLSAAHQHHPLPPQDSLPVREFLGTGPYSDGATLTSPYEELVLIWRPDKQTVRQLYGEDIRAAAAQSAPGMLITGAPFGSTTASTGVLLAPVKPGQAGGTGSITSSTHPMGHTDMHDSGTFGDPVVDASVANPSLQETGDEGLLDTRGVNMLAHGTCPEMHINFSL